MEENDYLKHQELDELITKETKNSKAEMLNSDSEEKNLQGPFRIINNSQIDE